MNRRSRARSMTPSASTRTAGEAGRGRDARPAAEDGSLRRAARSAERAARSDRCASAAGWRHDPRRGRPAAAPRGGGGRRRRRRISGNPLHQAREARGRPVVGSHRVPGRAPTRRSPTCSRSPFARRGRRWASMSGGGRILGRLPTVEPLSARLPPVDVTPFVALAPEGASARPDPHEVEEAFWIPLSSLRDAGVLAVVRHVIRGEQREWPAYPSPAGSIWGITQRILTGFLALADRAGRPSAAPRASRTARRDSAPRASTARPCRKCTAGERTRGSGRS